EPFSKVVIDCVGPLPRTRRGNQYLLTIMCMSSRFPEAIPLRSINSKNIVRELVKFFSWVGIPKVLQSDQGSNFTSRAFKEILRGLKIEQRLSSAYHPQSQGCVERFHQTLKNTLRMYCEEMSKMLVSAPVLRMPDYEKTICIVRGCQSEWCGWCVNART
ncbi:hypothetical protein O3P69_013441, partial [Scylla paramamosain]